ncbi:MAG: STAS/SEC14 domain-containing protein [Methyloprofundus sp.]|nr:STAS/SEC14 domain-containing protein [Methyloprofundus sp.]
MLEMLETDVKQAVAYRISGKITADEMNLALSAIKEKIAQYGEVFLYQEVAEFSGVEFTAIIAKFNFFFENGIAHISKVAVVTNAQWLHKIIDIEDDIFKKIDMQCFDFKDKQQAMDFLQASI